LHAIDLQLIEELLNVDVIPNFTGIAVEDDFHRLVFLIGWVVTQK
jgi:hypothetical protein